MPPISVGRSRSCAILVLVASCAVATASGCGSTGTGSPAADAASGFATAAQVFARPGDPSWFGLGVHLVDVQVVGKRGRVLEIGDGDGGRVFVVPVDPSAAEVLAVGAGISVRGELRRAPVAREAVRMYAVDGRTAGRIAASPHIIDAWTIARAP